MTRSTKRGGLIDSNNNGGSESDSKGENNGGEPVGITPSPSPTGQGLTAPLVPSTVLDGSVTGTTIGVPLHSTTKTANLPISSVDNTVTITPSGSGVTGTVSIPPGPTIAGAKTPSQKINGGAIAGGIVGVVIVVGAAIAFWCRFRRRRVARPMLPTSTTSPLPEQVPSLIMTTEGQTVLAVGQPISRSVVETQEEVLSKITGRRRRSQRVNGNDREEFGNQNAAGPAGGSGLETQMRAMAESMALIATHLQMQSLAEEQPPGYTAA